MNTPGGSGRFLLLILLSISILLDGYLIAPIFPWIASMGSIRPMIVFLDIPVGLPIAIDILPASLLFALFFSIVLGSNPSRFGPMNGQEIRRRLGSLTGGVAILFMCMIAGGMLFYFLGRFLPKEVRNGIDSFGVQMDIRDPVPGYETIHLHGSMFMLVGTIIGSMILLKRSARAMRPMVVAVEMPGPAEKISSRRIISRIPEPQEIRRPEELWLQEKARRLEEARRLEQARLEQIRLEQISLEEMRIEEIRREQVRREAQLREELRREEIRLEELRLAARPRVLVTRVPIVAPSPVELPL